jgi:rod shape-determining protein MreC
VSLREAPFGETRSPLRWSSVAALAAASLLALGLALGHGKGSDRPGFYGPSRQTMDRVAAPVGGVFSAPVRWVDGGFSAIGDYVFAGAQNRHLKAELAQARRWKDIALALAAENARFRALMGVKTDPPIPMVFAHTIFDARGPFSMTRLADAGSDRGVIEGAPVLGEHGLVGRVIGVSPGVSRILLLTDVESRTPVMAPRTNARAILSGDGGANPRLAYLRTHDALQPGDRVVTSGDGGVFPRGLPVGVVVRSADNDWRVALDSDSAPIDYVQILLFKDFSQLVDRSSLAPRTLPSAMTSEPVATILAGPSGQPPIGAAPSPVVQAANPSAAARGPTTPAAKATAFGQPASRP